MRFPVSPSRSSITASPSHAPRVADGPPMLLTGRAVHVSGDDGTIARSLEARGATVVGDDGAVDAVVHGVTDPDGFAERSVAPMAVDDWNRRCDAVLEQAIEAAQD